MVTLTHKLFDLFWMWSDDQIQCRFYFDFIYLSYHYILKCNWSSSCKQSSLVKSRFWIWRYSWYFKMTKKKKQISKIVRNVNEQAHSNVTEYLINIFLLVRLGPILVLWNLEFSRIFVNFSMKLKHFPAMLLKNFWQCFTQMISMDEVEDGPGYAG